MKTVRGSFAGLSDTKSDEDWRQPMEDIYFNSLIWKEGNAYVSYCPQFDVSSCGDTVEEARRMLKEAVYLFIEVAQEQGTLQTILEEAGYQRG